MLDVRPPGGSTQSNPGVSLRLNPDNTMVLHTESSGPGCTTGAVFPLGSVVLVQVVYTTSGSVTIAWDGVTTAQCDQPEIVLAEPDSVGYRKSSSGVCADLVYPSTGRSDGSYESTWSTPVECMRKCRAIHSTTTAFHMKEGTLCGCSETESGPCVAQNDQFVLNEVNSNNCPAGSTVVGSVSECQAAAEALGKSYWNGQSRSYYPMGCFADVHGDRMYFNYHHTGGPSSSHQQICVKLPSSTYEIFASPRPIVGPTALWRLGANVDQLEPFVGEMLDVEMVTYGESCFGAIHCAPGTYFDNSAVCAVMTIADCPPGSEYFSASATTDDMFGSTSDDSECKLCASGKAKQTRNVTEMCATCPLGNSFVSSSQCQLCVAGKYQDQLGISSVTCKECPNGKVAANIGSISVAACTACQAGKYADERSRCTECPAGTFRNSQGAHEVAGCDACEVGLYNPKPGLDTNCYPCPTASTAGETQCSGCDPGQFKQTNDECIDCPGGYYTNDRDMRECSECPGGYHAKDFSTISREFDRRHDTCSSCPRGQYGDVPKAVNITTGCTLCDAGRYSDLEAVSKIMQGEETFCQKCPLGRWSSDSGQKKDSACQFCKPGRFSDSSAASSVDSCKACAKGRFNDAVGAAAVEDCLACPAGFIQATRGQAYCLPCTPGKTQNQAGQDNCKLCAVGKYSLSMESADPSCKLCDVGRYQANRGRPACSACGPGTFSNTTGRQSCTLCPSSMYNDDKLGTTCKSCIRGYYSASAGSTKCQPCNPGTFSNVNGSRSCNDCPPSTFNDDKGSTTCVKCNIGKISTKYGSTSCQNCPAGKIELASNSNTCSECPQGWQRAEDENATACIQCKQGETTVATGATTCAKCDFGQFGLAKGVCAECRGVGEYTDSRGATECLKCTNGEVNDGMSSCDKCDLGKHGDTTTGLCSACSEGQYQDARGQGTCQSCLIAGWIPNDKRTDCIKPPWPFAEECQKTEYLDDTTEKKENYTCVACPEGADCSASNASLSTLLSEAGWWRVPEAYGPGTELFARCPFPQDCLPARPGQSNCVNTTTQDLCSRCKVGYDRISARCEICRKNEIGLRVALMLGLAIICLALLLRSRHFLLKKWRKYKIAVKDASLAAKVIISFLQVSMSLPSMLSDFEFPEEYVIFLHKISFVNVDFMSIVGAQCVIDVDFRFSMLVSLCIPLCVLTLIVLAYLAGQYKISRTTKKLTIESKKKLMGKLFDMSDVDLSGELDAEEFIQMVEFVARRKVVREIRSLSESHVHRIMLRAGAQLPRRSHDPMLLKRADFIESVVSAAGEAKTKAIKDNATKDNANNDRSGNGLTLAQCIPLNRAVTVTRKQALQSTCLSIMVQLFLMIHAPIAAKSFYYFDCHRLGTEKSLLRRDYSLECGGERYNEYLPVALTLLLGFALLLPIMLSGFLFQHRGDLYTPKTRRKIGWLYWRFVNGAEFWEIHELLRKMILTGLLIYLPSKVRTPSAIVVCTLCCCTLNYFHPHRNKLVFWIDEICAILTTAKYLVAVFGMSMGDDMSSEEKGYLGYLLIGMDCTIIVGGNLCMVALFFLLSRDVLDAQIQTKAKNSATAVVPAGLSEAVVSDRPMRRLSLSMAHVKKVRFFSSSSSCKNFSKFPLVFWPRPPS